MDVPKKLMFGLMWLALTSPLIAGEVQLVWDSNPPGDLVQAYLVYEHVGKTYIPVATSPTNGVTIKDVPVGDHCYVVTASNFWGESVFSDEACTHVVVGNVDDPDDLDKIPPISAIYGLAETNFPQFEVSWWGIDDPGGSGIRSYDVYVSENDGPFLPWLTDTSSTLAVYQGLPDRKYGFYVIAVDRAGNRGAVPDEAQANTLTSWMDGEPPVAGMFGLPSESYPAFQVTWWGLDTPGGSGVVDYDIYVADNDGPLELWLKNAPFNESTFFGVLGHYYEFYAVARDRAGNESNFPLYPQASTKVSKLNSAPKFEKLPTFNARLGEWIFISAKAHDADEPAQSLTYSVENSDLPDFHFDTILGSFRWKPSIPFAGQEVHIDIRATDNGIPSLSTVQRVTIIVEDYFALELGTNQVTRTQSATIPVNLYGSQPLTDIYVKFNVEPASAIKDLQWKTQWGGNCIENAWQETPGSLWVYMANCPNLKITGQRKLGDLILTIPEDWQGVVQIEPEEILTSTSNLQEQPHFDNNIGQLTVSHWKPTLHIRYVANDGFYLTISGKPDTFYQIEFQSSIYGLGNWYPLTQIGMTKNTEVWGPLKWDLKDAIFRLREIPEPVEP